MMAVTYFIQGASGKCLKCRHQRYTGAAKLTRNSKLVCANCGHVRTVSDAFRSSVQMRGRKKLLPKRELK